MSMSDKNTDHGVTNIWRPQAFSSHVIQTTTGIDQLNTYSGIVVKFAPPRRSPVHLSCEGSQSEHLGLWTMDAKFGFTSTPKLDAELLVVRFIMSGSLVRHSYWGGDHVGCVDRAMLESFETIREAQASADFSALTATVTRQALFAAYNALEGSSPRTLPQFAPVVDVTSTGIIALRQTLHSLHRRLKVVTGASDFILSLMEEIVIYQLISIWPKIEGSVSQPSAISSRSIRRVIDYIEANLSRKLTIAEIAAAAGVGVRTLQTAFRRHVGCTPVQYLIDRRLDLVHKALQSPDRTMTIRQIATQLGFSHMSDFSRRYRQRYGYAPKMSR